MEKERDVKELSMTNIDNSPAGRKLTRNRRTLGFQTFAVKLLID